MYCLREELLATALIARIPPSRASEFPSSASLGQVPLDKPLQSSQLLKTQTGDCKGTLRAASSPSGCFHGGMGSRSSCSRSGRRYALQASPRFPFTIRHRATTCSIIKSSAVEALFERGVHPPTAVRSPFDAEMVQGADEAKRCAALRRHGLPPSSTTLRPLNQHSH